MNEPVLIDVSHTLENELITYKGLPAPIICDFLSREASRSHYDGGAEFHIGKIEMVGNTGTYLDAPFHRYADGKDLSELPLSSLAGLDAVVVRVDTSQQKGIGPEFFQGLTLQNKAVLVHTGWSKHWGTDQYFEGNPFLTEAAAVYLRDAEVKLVGIDSLNIDDASTRLRPVHSLLLRSEILIVEHLCNLHLLPTIGFRFFAVPVKVKQFGTFPVRAFGMLDK